MNKSLFLALLASFLLGSFHPANSTGLCGDYYCPYVSVSAPAQIYAGQAVTIVMDTGPSTPFTGTLQATTIVGMEAIWISGPVFGFSTTRSGNTFYLNGIFDAPGSSYYYFLAGDDIGNIGCNFNCNYPEIFNIERTPAVPEPSTWAMMILGFSSVALRRHRAKRLAKALTSTRVGHQFPKPDGTVRA